MASAHHRERRLGGPEDAHVSSCGAACTGGAQSLRSTAGRAGDDEAREPAERRIVRVLARRDLAGVEGFAVAARSAPASPDDRAGASAESGPRPSSRPARPPTWCSSWKVRSAARGSPLARPRSASTIPTRLSFGKWCPFATSWVPMTMSTWPSAISLELLAHALRGRDQVARQDHDARPGKQRRRLLLQPLDAGAAGDEASPSAWHCGQASGARRRDSRNDGRRAGAEAMVDQPRIAVRAGEAEAAGAAQRQRRIAAAVEEQQRLLAALQRSLDGLGEPRRDEAPARRAFAGEVDRPRSPADAGRRTAPAGAGGGSGRAAH